MKKVLIIKRNDNDFDQYVIKRIADECPEADVMDLFWIKGRIGRKLVKILKTTFKGKFLGIVCRINKSKLKNYNTIILFDDYPDLPIVDYLKRYNKDSLYKMWFWNVPNYSIDNYREKLELYCFDKAFCDKNEIEYINQFYLTEVNKVEKYNNKFEYYDVVYIGYDKNRYEILKEITEKFDEYKFKSKIILISGDNKNKYKQTNNFVITNKFLKYEELISLENNAKAIIEIVNDNQTGLTLRTLEALCLGKKLITNNVAIKNMEIYSKSNVFIINEDPYDELTHFLNTPYDDQNINLNNYTIRNWYNNIIKN